VLVDLSALVQMNGRARCRVLGGVSVHQEPHSADREPTKTVGISGREHVIGAAVAGGIRCDHRGRNRERAAGARRMGGEAPAAMQAGEWAVESSVLFEPSSSVGLSRIFLAHSAGSIWTEWAVPGLRLKDGDREPAQRRRATENEARATCS
jgi:hypothetical protein